MYISTRPTRNQFTPIVLSFETLVSKSNDKAELITQEAVDLLLVDADEILLKGTRRRIDQYFKY